LIAGEKEERKTENLNHADSSERMGENVTRFSGIGWKIWKSVGVKYGSEVDFSPDDECIEI